MKWLHACKLSMSGPPSLHPQQLPKTHGGPNSCSSRSREDIMCAVVSLRDLPPSRPDSKGGRNARSCLCNLPGLQCVALTVTSVRFGSSESDTRLRVLSCPKHMVGRSKGNGFNLTNKQSNNRTHATGTDNSTQQHTTTNNNRKDTHTTQHGTTTTHTMHGNTHLTETTTTDYKKQ